MSQFERSLAELGVTVIHANSPQAKGRVERSFRTLQDRLVKEMRLARVKSVVQANEFLIKYHPMYNAKFKVKPVSEVDVHQPALSMRELDKIFCIREERTLRNDFTIAYNGKLYQIKDAIKAQKVAVEERHGWISAHNSQGPGFKISGDQETSQLKRIQKHRY